MTEMQLALKRQYATNADGLQRMLEKAEQTGKNVGGYTAEELRVLVADYRRLAKTGGVPPMPTLAQRRRRAS